MQYRVIAVLVVGLVAGLVIYFANSGVAIPRRQLVIIGVLAATGLLLVVFVIRAVRGARGGSTSGGAPGTAQALATELGYDYVRRPDKSFGRRFSHIPEIKRGEKKHAISGDLDGRRITFFNNSYIIPAGTVMVPVMHCVFACEAPNWPTLSVRPQWILGRLFARRKARKGIVLENRAFNDAFRVVCSDEAFAVTLLSPEMQEFMLEKKSGLSWRIGTEMVCMVYMGTLKLNRVGTSLDRMRKFWSLVPVELEGW